MTTVTLNHLNGSHSGEQRVARTQRDPSEAIDLAVRRWFGARAWFRAETHYSNSAYGVIYRSLGRGESTALTGKVRIDLS